MPRCFVGVPLDDAAREALCRQTGDGRVPGAVPRQNYHLTLCFIGRVEEEGLGRLEDALAGVARSHGPFGMRIERTGFFPERGKPRVWWAGPAAEIPELTRMAGNIRQAVRGLGYEIDEQPFRAHVTLARFKDSGPRSIRIDRPQNELKTQIVGVDVYIDRICLFNSELNESGVFYNILFEHLLNCE